MDLSRCTLFKVVVFFLKEKRFKTRPQKSGSIEALPFGFKLGKVSFTDTLMRFSGGLKVNVDGLLLRLVGWE